MRQKNRRAVKALLWIAAIGWIAVLFFFSGQTAEQSGSLSLRVTEFVLRAFPRLPFTVDQLHPILRKLAHFCFFGLEGFLLGLAMMYTLPEGWLGGMLAVLSCAVMAVLNEYHQSFADGRSCEVRDMFIDSAGALLGVLLAALLLGIVRRLRRRRRNVIIS